MSEAPYARSVTAQLEEAKRHPMVIFADSLATGRKDDGSKLRWDLMPWGPLEQVQRVLEFGAEKYAENNWQLVQDARRRYRNGAMRHLVAMMRGEWNDPESKLPHAAHAICCLLFWLHFHANPELDP